MPRSTFSKLAQSTVRQVRPSIAQRSSSITRTFIVQQPSIPAIYQNSLNTSTYICRSFSTTNSSLKGLSPTDEEPKPKEAEDHDISSVPAELTIEQYNELSEDYMNTLLEKLETLQETREDLDVEYSSGVLTLTFPPNGIYVINKQPPNKQIWLSSPISGPKRYDFVIVGDNQHSKEGTGSGEWIYLRDGSSLNSVLLNEVGIDLSTEDHIAIPNQEVQE